MKVIDALRRELLALAEKYPQESRSLLHMLALVEKLRERPAVATRRTRARHLRKSDRHYLVTTRGGTEFLIERRPQSADYLVPKTAFDATIKALLDHRDPVKFDVLLQAASDNARQPLPEYLVRTTVRLLQSEDLVRKEGTRYAFEAGAEPPRRAKRLWLMLPRE